MFLDEGGLYETKEDAATFVVRQGEVSRVDGPSAEAKEVFGAGPCCSTTASRRPWPTQREFAELHAKQWPEVTVISTVRQISTGPRPPATDPD